MIRIYTDGACQGNPGPGGWAAILLEDGRKTVLQGHEANTTNNRMELLAAIKALERAPEGAQMTVYADSQYLVYTMTRGWRRRANLDLWRRLDDLAAKRTVRWEWVEGHAGHPENEEVDRLANAQAGIQPAPLSGEERTRKVTTAAPTKALTHVDAQGRAQMVDVTQKPDTERVAVAKGRITMEKQTLELIMQGQMAKGDVLAVARAAGVMAAKKTWELIPLCHPLLLTGIEVNLEPNYEQSALDVTATVKTTGKTGVEMEALTAVAAAALTVYDMCKAVDRRMRIGDIRLVHKGGGKSGTLVLE